MDFEWIANKARENESKHRIGFVEAMEVFGDALSSTVSDPDHSLEEERLVIFGRTREGNTWSSRLRSVVVEFVSYRQDR